MMSSPSRQRIKVAVRARPTARFAHESINFDADTKTVSITVGKNEDQLRGFVNNKQEGWIFPVDAVLHNASQQRVYESCAEDLVRDLMRGFNGTLLAYGQTGAGKTYTMCGPQGDYQERGVIPRAIAQVFSEVKMSKEYSYKVHVSYLEIYNDVIYDLLATLPEENSGIITRNPPKPLNFSEDERRGVYVKGLICRQATDEEDALNMLFEGEENRTVGEHFLNKQSSRSHCIFTISVEARSYAKSCSEYTVSRLHLVDLAGSERLAKTQPSGTVEKEAMYINSSLSFLEQVIVALNDTSRDHIPLRQSKLTHYLGDCLKGNSNTVLIANVWTEAEQLLETVSSLRFASRVRCVQTNPARNTLKDPQLLLKEYEKEIESLKEELAMHNTIVNRGTVSYDCLSELEVEEIRQQVQSFLNGTIPDIELVSVKQVKEVFAQFKSLALSLDKNEEEDKLIEDRKVSSQSSSRTKKDSKVRSGVITETVGQTEGAGLGLGRASPLLKQSVSPATAVKKSRASSKVGKQSSKKAESPAPSLATNEERAPSEIGSQVTRPATPPTKEEAFEEFKKQRGSEINHIFLENKATLHRKKKEEADLSSTVNTIKKDIDKLQALLSEGTKADIGGAGRDEEAEDDEEGEIVMEEWQFSTLTQLRELKNTYRQHFAKLQSLQQELEYCTLYVAQSRRKLVNEFEKWYAEAFVGSFPEDSPDCKPAELVSDSKEFDILQDKLKKEKKESLAFYTAHLRTQKRGYHSRPID